MSYSDAIHVELCTVCECLGCFFLHQFFRLVAWQGSSFTSLRGLCRAYALLAHRSGFCLSYNRWAYGGVCVLIRFSNMLSLAESKRIRAIFISTVRALRTQGYRPVATWVIRFTTTLDSTHMVVSNPPLYVVGSIWSEARSEFHVRTLGEAIRWHHHYLLRARTENYKVARIIFM